STPTMLSPFAIEEEQNGISTTRAAMRISRKRGSWILQFANENRTCVTGAPRPVRLMSAFGAGGKSLRVKPYYLCRGRLGHAAQLLAHEQCRYDAGERRRAENPI